MNCDQFSTLTGMRCEPQPTRDGSECIAVVTPFAFFDGAGLSIFASAADHQLHLSDEGLTLFWLMGLHGAAAFEDRRAWRPLRTALAPYGVTLDDNGTIQTISGVDKAPLAFARFVSGLLAVDAWARENANAPAAATLVDEAAMYLRAWRTDAVSEPEPIVGFSGQAHQFALYQAGEYIDAIGPSKAASSSELRKLVDVKASAAHAALDIRVIVDDRRDADRAGVELSILGRFAKAWPMTRLIAASMAPPQAH